MDNLTIYCLATGKPIAQIHDDEVGVIIDALAHVPVAKQAEHLDRLALLSMRPSLLWMNVTPDSLDSIREAAPKQLLAYLLNRLFAPLERPNQPGRLPNIESLLAARRMRVTIWEQIDSTPMNPAELDQLLVLLLLIDSRFDLAKQLKPTYITQQWANITALVEDLTRWHNELSAAADKAARRAKMQAEFWNGGGNKLTQKPAQKQFAKVMPSQTQIEKRKKAAALNESGSFLDQLERELMVRASPKAHVESAPKPISAIKKPIMRFGVKREA
jgi:hypothetical protein